MLEKSIVSKTHRGKYKEEAKSADVSEHQNAFKRAKKLSFFLNLNRISDG